MFVQSVKAGKSGGAAVGPNRIEFGTAVATETRNAQHVLRVQHAFAAHVVHLVL